MNQNDGLKAAGPSSPEWAARHAESERNPAGARQESVAVFNERVKLNATFLNNLAVWFLGAGSVGALFNSFLAPGARGVERPLEIAALGVILSIVLKALANLMIGRLR